MCTTCMPLQKIIEYEGTQDFGFTPGSPHNECTMFRLPFVDINEVFDNVNIHIDKVDFFESIIF